jgi:hypothetical protein
MAPESERPGDLTAREAELLRRAELAEARGRELADYIEYLFNPYTVVSRELRAIEAAVRYKTGEAVDPRLDRPESSSQPGPKYLSDGHGCVSRATVADRDYGAERLADHDEARRAGWE